MLSDLALKPEADSIEAVCGFRRAMNLHLAVFVLPKCNWEACQV